MRGVVPLVVAGVMGTALWVGLSPRTSEARADRIELATPETDFSAVALVALPQEPTDSERRAELNQRLQTMISEGRGARLEDAKVRLPRNSRSAQARGQASGQISGPISGKNSGQRGYREPHLDLKTPPVIPDNDLDCLTQAIYYEARNESEAGQAAVAEVVMNRVRHASYPNQVCAVVYQRNSRTCQFTFTCDGSIGRNAIRPQVWARAQQIARDVYEGRSASQLPLNSVNYHANYVRPSWGQRLDRVRQIGAHIFYGSARGAGQTPGSSPTLNAPTPQSTGNLFVRDSALDEAYARHVAGANGADQT